MSKVNHALRPFLPADTMALRELFAASIEELTQEDYDDDQRAAWASTAEDAQAFAEKLGSMLTLVVHDGEEYLGFACLKDNNRIEMLYVHPFYAGEGVGTALCDALEKLAAARGTADITTEASETAVMFFEGRGYVAQMRNSVPVGGEWLSNTTMKKQLKPTGGKAAP